jgi:hypothetical protein
VMAGFSSSMETFRAVAAMPILSPFFKYGGVIIVMVV